MDYLLRNYMNFRVPVKYKSEKKIQLKKKKVTVGGVNVILILLHITHHNYPSVSMCTLYPKLSPVKCNDILLSIHLPCTVID